MTALQQQGQAAKDAAYVLSTAGTARKNAALAAIADTLAQHQSQWLEANAQDVAAAKEAGIRPAMLDRLTLTPERIAGIVEGVRQVAALPDPIGRVDKMETRPNGLIIGRRRVPLGSSPSSLRPGPTSPWTRRPCASNPATPASSGAARRPSAPTAARRS